MCFFGDEISTYVENLLCQNNDIEQIVKFFSFFEWMAIQKNLYINQVLSTTILYNLGGNSDLLQKAESYMKPHTKKLSKEIEALHSGNLPL